MKFDQQAGSHPALATEPNTPANKIVTETKTVTTRVVSDTKTAVGTLANVTLAEPAKGIANSTITITDNTGKAMNYTVTQSTKILGATLDVLTLNQLKIGEKIKIKTKEGSEEASAIKINNLEKCSTFLCQKTFGKKSAC